MFVCSCVHVMPIPAGSRQMNLILSYLGVCSASSFGSKDTFAALLVHSFTHCGRTLLGGIVTANGNSNSHNSRTSSHRKRNKTHCETAASITWSRPHPLRMRVFCGVKWLTSNSILYWKRSSSATEHFQRKPHKCSDLHCPLSKSYRLWDE